jgi:hypothetical protein
MTKACSFVTTYSVPVFKKWKEKRPQTNTETLQNNSKWSILYYVVYLYWDKKDSLLHVSVDYLFIIYYIKV